MPLWILCVIHTRSIFPFFSPVSNQSFPLKLGSDTISVYCHVARLGPCGAGGWTLVMKMNGSKVHKFYSRFQRSFYQIKKVEKKDNRLEN